MKTPVYSTIIALFYSITSCAQTKFKEGIVKGKRETFEVMRSPVVHNQNHIFIYPKKNKYKGPIPDPKDNYQFRVLTSDIHVDIDKIKQIVNDVLKDKINLLHERKEILGMRFIFNTDGTLADNNFTLLKVSKITPAEIKLIDNRLRSDIKATFTGIDYKHYVAVDYNFRAIQF